MTPQDHFIDYKLINFNVPKYLINNFDELVKFKRISRTSLLIGLMESWMRHEVKKLEDDNKFNRLIRDMSLRNRTKSNLDRGRKDQFDDVLPAPIFSNDDDDWETRFMTL